MNIASVHLNVDKYYVPLFVTRRCSSLVCILVPLTLIDMRINQNVKEIEKMVNSDSCQPPLSQISIFILKYCCIFLLFSKWLYLLCNFVCLYKVVVKVDWMVSAGKWGNKKQTFKIWKVSKRFNKCFIKEYGDFFRSICLEIETCWWLAL